ncbi:MAG: PilZ domain-containing protein [Candidatus Omnitrophota bacterium]|nr:MAG: PilZ domain-containing protein [Candidatus Omnitrophota bacterium]
MIYYPDMGQERRKYLRTEAPVNIRIIDSRNAVQETQTKDISPLGLRFETKKEDIDINEEVELKIEIPGTLNSVHAKAKIVWKKKLSTEDGAPFDIGCEFARIEEDNKNTFLKYFCDLLYKERKEMKQEV